jgi:hypothetical protein
MGVADTRQQLRVFQAQMPALAAESLQTVAQIFGPSRTFLSKPLEDSKASVLLYFATHLQQKNPFIQQISVSINLAPYIGPRD